jgi:hypothetical protein
MKFTAEKIAEIEKEIEQLNRDSEDKRQAIANMKLYLETAKSLDRDQEKLLYRATFVKLLRTCDSLRFAELLQEALKEVPSGKVERMQ